MPTTPRIISWALLMSLAILIGIAAARSHTQALARSFCPCVCVYTLEVYIQLLYDIPRALALSPYRRHTHFIYIYVCGQVASPLSVRCPACIRCPTLSVSLLDRTQRQNCTRTLVKRRRVRSASIYILYIRSKLEKRGLSRIHPRDRTTNSQLPRRGERSSATSKERERESSVRVCV